MGVLKIAGGILLAFFIIILIVIAIGAAMDYELTKRAPTVDLDILQKAIDRLEMATNSLTIP